MPPTRRERLRVQTLAEIRSRALDQIAEGGPAALSLNAIAKAMGMSGPALYRYFASRDELLADLVTAGYGELADAVRAPTDTDPAARIHASAAAYRAWALEHPQRFSMLFGLRPEGFSDPDEAIAAIQPAMDHLVDALGDESLGVVLWTRLHGIVTLELSGALGDMGLDVEALLRSEVDAVLAASPG